MARRYELYVQVARTVSEILFLPQQHKIHIFELTCNVLSNYINILMTAFLMIFRRFPTIFEDFRNFPKLFLRCPKISEDCRIPSRKTRRCFNDTATNLSTI